MKAIGVSNSSGAFKFTQGLDITERVPLPRTRYVPGIRPNSTLISESGLYKTVMRSDKPQAKPFQDWVTKVVLPEYVYLPEYRTVLDERTEPATVPARNGLVSLDPSVKTMSSIEIAELTGKEHPKVTADIKRILLKAGIDPAVFGGIFLDSYKREQIYYNLPRLECDLVITGYSVPYRLKVIQR